MRSLNWVISVCLTCVLLSSVSCLDKGVDPDVQFQDDLDAIDAHLANNSITAYKDPSGIRLAVNTLGTAGLPPRRDQQAKVKYKGMLLDGTVFEENVITNYVGNFITGWQRGLTMLPKGTSATIYIPSALGYGTQAVGPIPANSILIFEVEMQDVILSAGEKLRAPTDITAIDNYLTENNITAVADTTGVRYVITQTGTGDAPGWYSKVKFNYTGKLMNGTEFFTGTSEPNSAFDSRVVDYIHGISIALSKLSPGGKGTFYIPSGLAFGPNDQSTAPVPANSNVIYEIELTEIVPE